MNEDRSTLKAIKNTPLMLAYVQVCLLLLSRLPLRTRVLQNRHVMTGKGIRAREQAAYAAFATTLTADRKSDVSRELFSLLTTNKEQIIAANARDI